MPGRSCVVFAILLASLMLCLGGCGYTQQSKFQMSFLPAPPRGAAPPMEFVEPPSLHSNPYLTDIAAVMIAKPQLPSPPSRGDNLIDRAEQRYQRGRKLYQAKNFEQARREFDAAVDLMLQASDSNPTDRQDFERRFDRMIDSIHRYDLAGLGSAAAVEDSRFEKAPLEDILEMTFPVDPKLKLRLREQVQTTVSQLPLSLNDAVQGYIHYFSSARGRKTLLAGLERMGRYRPMIQRILEEEGLPQELIHLAQAESGFLPRAMSRAKAAGLWQFVNWRGRQYGLNQTRYVDDRFDPEKATRAAARHLRDLYTEFGDWYLAIAAYNCGPGVVERAVERTGYADFWELRSRRVLPRETTNYVPIIVAMTIMVKNAADYGLENVVADPPLEYETLEIASATHLALVADLTDTPVSELTAMNPSLFKGVAPEGFTLRIPQGTAATLIAALEMIPPERRASWRMHKVEGGETLAAIGRRYGAKPSVIAAVNRLAASPVAGDRLVIPAVYKETAPARHPSARRPAARKGRKAPAVLARTASNRRAATSSRN